MKKIYPKLKPTKTQQPKVQWIGDRIVGCQSTNHTSCKGELWECEQCHKIICWEEGSADSPEICDDCWYDIRMAKGNIESIGILEWWRLNYETT